MEVRLRWWLGFIAGVNFFIPSLSCILLIKSHFLWLIHLKIVDHIYSSRLNEFNSFPIPQFWWFLSRRVVIKADPEKLVSLSFLLFPSLSLSLSSPHLRIVCSSPVRFFCLNLLFLSLLSSSNWLTSLFLIELIQCSASTAISSMLIFLNTFF